MGSVTKLRTRKPSCRVAWPLILLAGEMKTGKSYAAAQFTGDPRVGRAFWLDLGEGCADEYGLVPGADYEILEHNGTWIDIVETVRAVRDYAAEELAGGSKPVVLVIDSMSAEWAMLTEWVNKRAKRSKSNQQKLARDPDEMIDISANYWNDANSRHNQLMNLLKTFPGVVIMTSLETEKMQMGPGGRPMENAPKVAKPDCQKRVPADATVWVRLSLSEAPAVVGIRSVRMNIRPGVDKPKPIQDFSLAKLVFDDMGLGSGDAEVRDIPVLDADQVAPGEEVEVSAPRVDWGAEMKACGADRAKWNALYAKAPTDELKARIKAAGAAAFKAAQASAEEMPKVVEGEAVAPTPIARPTRLEKAVSANEVFDKLLDCSDFDQAEALAMTAPRVDVTGFLTDDIREVLDIGSGEKVKLPEFGQLVADYINRRGMSVNAAIGGEAA